MELHLLPIRSGGAAENMASDFLLLQRYPEAAQVRFRHYGWHRPAFTFGYGQKIDWVRQQLPADDPYELCRRPTGTQKQGGRRRPLRCLPCPSPVDVKIPLDGILPILPGTIAAPTAAVIV
jgi:hypothetical protein